MREALHANGLISEARERVCDQDLLQGHFFDQFFKVADYRFSRVTASSVKVESFDSQFSWDVKVKIWIVTNVNHLRRSNVAYGAHFLVDVCCLLG